jgi:hypothetical protein
MKLDDLLRQRREWYEQNSLIVPGGGKCLSLAELDALGPGGAGIDRETCERCFTLHRRLLAARHDAGSTGDAPREMERGAAGETPAGRLKPPPHK